LTFISSHYQTFLVSCFVLILQISGLEEKIKMFSWREDSTPLKSPHLILQPIQVWGWDLLESLHLES